MTGSEHSLEQHRPRCRYKGPASSYETMVPGYFRMVEEDNPRFLPAMHALDRQPILEKQVSCLSTKLLTMGLKQEELDELLLGKKRAGNQ